ncbi:uncharacterized protein LOC135830770 [Sycon ciliatum]|uniref:uncharacterized protein LOC135830770 n=1 Tax=Sycon ciliatum TaxID=27933 RepID=UPI0031F62C40
MQTNCTRVLKDIVLSRCSTTEKCFSVCYPAGQVILASSESRNLYAFKDDEQLCVAQLPACVTSLSLVRVSCQVSGTNEECPFVVCSTSCGGIWLIPLTELLDRPVTASSSSCQPGGRKRSRLSPAIEPVQKRTKADASQHELLPTHVDQGVENVPADQRSQSAGRALLQVDNESVFSSLLKQGTGSGKHGKAATATTTACTTGSSGGNSVTTALPNFWDATSRVCDVSLRYRSAIVPDSCVVSATPTALMIASHPPDCTSILEVYPVQCCSDGQVSIGRATRVSAAFPLNVNRIIPIVLTRSPLCCGWPVSQDMLDYLVDDGSQGSADNDALLVVTDDGGVHRVLPGQCSATGNMTSSPLHNSLLLQCVAPVIDIFPVCITSSNKDRSANGLVAVSKSGQVSLWCVARVGLVLRQFEFQDHVPAPVCCCCILQSPSGNGTELQDVLVCAGPSAVTFARLPSIEQLVKSSPSTVLKKCLLATADVCHTWSLRTNACLCRTRSGSVIELTCPTLGATSTGSLSGGSLRTSDTMKDVLAKLRAISDRIVALQEDESTVDRLLAAVNHALHNLKSLQSTGFGEQNSRGKHRALSVSASAVLGVESNGLRASHVECSVENCTSHMLPCAYSVHASVTYSSAGCQQVLPSWSVAVPLADLAAQAVRWFQVPLLSQHLSCCTVSVSFYLVVDISQLLASAMSTNSPTSAAIGTESDCVVTLIHTEQLNILSFCKASSPDDIPAPKEPQQSILLPVQMMSDIARHSRHSTHAAGQRQASNQEASHLHLHSISLHQPLSSAQVTSTLSTLLGMEFQPSQRYLLTAPTGCKFWLEHSQVAMDMPDRPVGSDDSDSAEQCSLCSEKISNAAPLNMVCISISAHDRSLLCTLRMALSQHFKMVLDGEAKSYCTAATAAPASDLSRRMKPLTPRLLELRDRFTNLQGLILDTARSKQQPLSIDRLSSTVCEDLSRLREDMWHVYTELVNLPIIPCKARLEELQAKDMHS